MMIKHPSDAVRKRLHFAAALAFLALVPFLVSRIADGQAGEASSPADEAAAADQILASFVRELEHEAAAMPRVTRESIDDDILYEALNAVHWTDDEQLLEAMKRCPPEEKARYQCIRDAISSDQ